MKYNVLKDLGFGEKEIEVYLAILEQGRMTPSEIALSTGIQRTTVYGVAKELIDKGVIAEGRVKKHTYFTALPLDSLADMVRKKERALQDKKVLAQQAIETLETLARHTKSSIPKLTFIYEENLLDFLYKQTPEWNRSLDRRGGVWWGFQNTSFLPAYQKWVDWYWQEQAPESIILRLLTNESEPEKQMKGRGYNRRLIKFWKGGKDFTASTWIIGDYIVMIATDQKPHYLVQIHDETMANNMREMFKSIWDNQD